MNYIFKIEYLFNLCLMFMFISGMLVFCSNRKHLLLTLLSLEFIVLLLFLIMILFIKVVGYEYYMILVFLTFAVCEGAMGLSILVSLIKCHGSDNIMSLSFLMW